LPDELVLKFVIDEVEKIREKGFLLDGKIKILKNPNSLFYFFKGYPRTLNQAEMLYRQMKVDHVIALNVPSDEIINRLKDRWVHLPSGRVYNLQWSPPKVSGKDDETGEPLYQREDDKPAVIRHRLDTYNKNTNPIMEFYRQLDVLQEFHGRESDKIWPEVKKYLDRVLTSTI
jgi:nucleoside-triphosphate--adenylate kinase